MDRFQITADIDATVLIGKFAHGAPLSAEPVITSPYILNNGEVRLYGESNIIVKIKSAKWDEFYRLVEQIVSDAIARAVDDDKIGTIYEILL